MHVTSISSLIIQLQFNGFMARQATSSEYLVALLCQGFRVAAARRLLKRRPFQATQGRTGPRLRVAWTTTKKRREDLGGRV